MTARMQKASPNDSIRVPNPGSEEAIALGCTCPVFDNHHGCGYLGQPDVFVYVGGCQIHRLPAERRTEP